MLTVQQTRGETQGKGCCLLRGQEGRRQEAFTGQEDRQGRLQDGRGPRRLRLLEIVANCTTSLTFLCDFTLEWRGGSGHQLHLRGWWDMAGWLSDICCASQAWELIKINEIDQWRL